MKRNITWMIISVIAMIAFPLISAKVLHSPFRSSFLDMFFNPVFFAVLGISAGKDIKKHWFLPLFASVLYPFGLILSLHAKYIDDLIRFAIVYLILGMIFMFVSYRVRNNEGKPDFRKIAKRSLIVTLIANVACFLINRITFIFTDNIFLGLTSDGGECRQTVGFGWLVTRLYPMTVAGEAPSKIIKISFEPFSLIITLIVIFIISFILMLLFGKHTHVEKE